MPKPMTSRAAFQRVFVATDFSQGGARALDRALRLPLAPEAQVFLAHVLPLDHSSGSPAKAARQALEGLAQGAAASLARAGRPGVEVLPILESGSAAEELAAAARRVGAELVVLGRHSYRRVRDVFLGSTAHRLVRIADLPVLVVSGDPRRPYRAPLAAIDLESGSVSTLHLLLRVLEEGARTVDVAHAFEVPFEAMRFPMFDVSKLNRWGQKFRREAARKVSEFLAALPDMGVVWKPTLRSGAAAMAVLAEAERLETDLLAIGTHGRKGPARLLLGSVAERVLARAPCDLLVARPVRASRLLRAGGHLAARGGG